MSLWYETSLESSFKSTQASNNTAIDTWYDNNPQAVVKNNATQTTTTNQPKFMENVFGAIPAIRFDGSDDRMPFDGTFLAATNYTIFVLEQRRASALNFFMGGTGTLQYTALALGYRVSGTAIAQSHFSHDMDTDAATIPAYSSPIPRIHTFWFSQTAGMKYWLNGGATPDKADPTRIVALISNAGMSLGLPGSSYNGDLAEVIMFSRELTTEERQAIETYLGKKYNIPIS